MNSKIVPGDPAVESMEPTAEDLKKVELDLVDLKDTASVGSKRNGELVNHFDALLAKHPPLPHEEIMVLAKKASEGDRLAREKMIKHNLRLVRKFANKHRNRGLDLHDLEEEGVIGLMKGVDRFDYRKGYHLSTYVSWWIIQSIRRALANSGREIRLPVHVVELQGRIRRVAGELGRELQRRPTVDEIAEKVGCPVEKIEEAFSGRGKVSYSLDDNSSLTTDGKDDVDHHQRVADPHGSSPTETVVAKENAGILIENLAIFFAMLNSLTLKDKDRAVFRFFYNLDSRPDVYKNLEITGDRFNVTRERVRQILKKVWGLLESRFSAIPFDKNGLENLPRLIHGIDDPTGKQTPMEILIREANQRVPSVSVDEHRRKTPNKLSWRRWRPSHFRASPAFKNWKPGKNRGDTISVIISYLADAYEVEEQRVSSTVPPSDKIGTWVQGLCVYFTQNLKIDIWEITSRFGYRTAKGTQRMLEEVSETVENDEIVRRDVEGLLRHFKEVMGLH